MRSLTPQERRAKLRKLARDEGYESVMAMLEDEASDSINHGICTEPDCDGTTDSIEPDAEEGYCEFCGKNSVASALILAGFI